MSVETDAARPALDPSISPTAFKDFYWLKEELLKFCREHRLSTVGSKQDLARRITGFLETGEFTREQPAKITGQRSKKRVELKDLSLDTLITADYKSDQVHREFFKSVIGPHFHFTTAFMRFFKENPGKTYRQAVSFWEAEHTRQASPEIRSEIDPQFEYNRFMRDFRADNPEKSFKEAVAAWKIVRQQPGDRRYHPAQTQNEQQN